MIREAIKQRIRDLGLTQKEVCRAIKVKEQNLSSFTTGMRSYPYDRFIALLTLLGLSVGKKGCFVGEYPPNEIKTALRAFIKGSGMKLREVSERSRVKSSTLSSFMTGKRPISLSSLEKVMEALGLGLVCYGEPEIFEKETSKRQ